jgi:hypothetical protein
MCNNGLLIKISPEKIRAASWKLWEEIVDGTMPTENDSIEEYDEIINSILKIIIPPRHENLAQDAP